jgi:pyruvate/2-oxoglutarate dehydrogenase complex dihydrolipoamide dehydrogenase (E3) component
MTTDSYQTIVIGAGSGGMTVAIGMAGLGRKVALVEGGHIGGDCTNVGCVPSKTLIHLANAGHVRDAAAALAEVRAKRDSLRERETEEVEHMPNLDLIRGWASFSGPNTLSVAGAGGTRRLQGQNIVIATGSRPRELSIPGLPADRSLTNETIFELAATPRHLAVIGAGVIASELAVAFSKLGVQVSMVSTGSRVLSSSLPEASEALAAALEERGIAIYLNTKVERYDESAQTLYLRRSDQPVALDGVDYVLVAVGRTRNLERLQLEQAGVRYDAGGIYTDSYGATGVAGLFAIGDVTRTSVFTHSANAQGRRAVQRIAFPYLPARGPEPLFPSATFADPEVAQVGLLPPEIARRYHPELVRRYRVELKDLDRGYTDGVRHGFIIVDAIRLSGRILGATIVGPRASEMISFFTLAISQGIPLSKIYGLVYPYPTYSNGILKVADAYMRATLPHLRQELAAYLRYRLARPPQPANGAPAKRAAAPAAPVAGNE